MELFRVKSCSPGRDAAPAGTQPHRTGACRCREEGLAVRPIADAGCERGTVESRVAWDLPRAGFERRAELRQRQKLWVGKDLRLPALDPGACKRNVPRIPS